MYFIVNYDLFWKHPQTFKTFNEAFKEYKNLGDENSMIEYYGPGYKRQLVWCEKYTENNVSKNYQLKDKNSVKKVQ